jgi:hypothetical protein
MLMKLSGNSLYRNADQPTSRTIVSSEGRESEAYARWNRAEMAAAQ